MLKTPQRPVRSGATHTVGLFLALGVLVLFAAVVVFFVVRSPGKNRGNVTSTAEPDASLLPGQTGSAANRYGGGQGFVVQAVDRNDPTKLRSEITAERSHPVENEPFRVMLDKPVIWWFMPDGRTVWVRADSGKAYVSDQGQGAPSKPQDGMLKGNVIVKLFAPKGAGARPDPEKDRPIAVVQTELLTYDAELMQAVAPGRFDLKSDTVDAVLTDVTVLFNDVQQRLEWFYTPNDGVVTVKQGAPAGEKKTVAAKPAPTPAKGTKGTGKGAAKGTAGERKTPVESMYRLVCGEHVTVSQGARQVEAEQLQAWVRLIDNELRPGALGEATKTAKAAPVKPVAAPVAKPAGEAKTTTPVVAAKPAPEGDVLVPSATASDEPVTIEWKGPMEVKPLAEAVAELATNDVNVRFTSVAESGVVFTDVKTNAKATGERIDYAATRKVLGLSSVNPLGTGLVMPGNGHAEAQKFEIDLVTGIAHVSGPGVLTSKKDDAKGDVARTFSWIDSADFHFLLNDKGDVTSSLKELHADGDVMAAEGERWLKGGAMIGYFTPVQGKASRIEKLEVVGHAQGQDGKGGALASDTLVMAFVPMEGKPEQSDPSVVTAQGNVKATRTDSTLKAGWLEATLERVAKGEKRDVAVTKVVATDIDFVNNDGVTAKAPRLVAAPEEKVAHLTGPAGSVQVSKDGSVIAGADMVFEEKTRRLTVESPGTLDHTVAAKKDEPPGRVHAAWEKRLTFDDISGEAVCEGGVEAVVTKGVAGAPDLERDTMKSQMLRLWLTPGKVEASPKVAVIGAPKDTVKDAAKQERTLLRASLEGDAANPAKVESRKYSVEKPGELEQLMYLESAKIEPDNEHGVLMVPGSGKLLVLDQRVSAKKAAAAAKNDMESAAGGKGTSLFTWDGSMKLDRPTGTMTMSRGVQLVHQPLEADKQSELHCETLTAVVREAKPKPEAAGTRAEQSFSGELVSADADGAVSMWYGGRKMEADVAHYDAVKRTLNAKARGENMVTVFDPKSAVPVTAKEVDWDLVLDRITIKKPGTVVVPK